MRAISPCQGLPRSGQRRLINMEPVILNDEASAFEFNLLNAIIESETGAVWCFWPREHTWNVRCSSEFLAFCSLAGSQNRRMLSCEIPRVDVLRGLASRGIESEALFHDLSTSSDTTIRTVSSLGNDHREISIRIVPVCGNDVVYGHLIRFREVVPEVLTRNLLHTIASSRQMIALLSPREQEVLRLIAAGRTNKAISISTGISEKTVEKHRSRILQKLKLNSTADLLRLVTRATLLEDLNQLSPNRQ